MISFKSGKDFVLVVLGSGMEAIGDEDAMDECLGSNRIVQQDFIYEISIYGFFVRPMGGLQVSHSLNPCIYATTLDERDELSNITLNKLMEIATQCV